jgi:hypothetical protein
MSDSLNFWAAVIAPFIFEAMRVGVTDLGSITISLATAGTISMTLITHQSGGKPYVDTRGECPKSGVNISARWSWPPHRWEGVSLSSREESKPGGQFPLI